MYHVQVNDTIMTTGIQIKSQEMLSIENIRKAYGFTSEKWNFETISPLYSGDNEDSLIEHMRTKIWEDGHGGVILQPGWFFKNFFNFSYGDHLWNLVKRLILFCPDTVEDEQRTKKYLSGCLKYRDCKRCSCNDKQNRRNI